MVFCIRDFARRHHASDYAVRTHIDRMVHAGIIARDDAKNGVLITYLGGEGCSANAGKNARPTQKPRRSHARATQQREFLPIIEENKEIKKEESARAHASPPAETIPEGWGWIFDDEEPV